MNEVPKTNITTENRVSKKETSIPTINFQGLCQFRVSGRVNHAKFGEAFCWKPWTRPLVRPFYSPRMAVPKWWIRNVVASLHHCTIVVVDHGNDCWCEQSIDLLKVTRHLEKTEQRKTSLTHNPRINFISMFFFFFWLLGVCMGIEFTYCAPLTSKEAL